MLISSVCNYQKRDMRLFSPLFLYFSQNKRCINCPFLSYIHYLNVSVLNDSKQIKQTQWRNIKLKETTRISIIFLFQTMIQLNMTPFQEMYN